MAIDRAARARRRREQRAAAQHAPPPEERRRLGAAATEVEGLFSAGAKHRLERLEWVAVAREDERESGAGPLDFDAGVIRLGPADDERTG
ncbi:hypothetical protein A8924_7242 [Saccharopolyspora erythraea NRRL 2338]|uniref:Uncharacterized protein n=2 Tax=Saccharopolyspora erythraea TaxID=1836 RepID=A4FPR9_SACEN|nr:hypothetical protein [Saccharopolyspora erythraea]EQD86928.1 hypothetical protein N599_07050 [Saccharopolyspora erythraea D]PFG99689.1 hypothetical protein A8924_7242 [Saccharopolyspora erythraea NRRL 2338]QRK89574.1 hypothetical protein JQX30_34450 [Saccharopolyspora erythraea]CAM06044.1 hypothetical protein SACE_6880 [Saccharopolyspora erythraea NRRL 2338]